MRDRRQDLAEIDFNQKQQLLTGRPFAWDLFGQLPTRDDFEQAWLIHGEKLTAAFVQENPGMRPFGWWLIDHGIERPVVGQQWFTDEYREKLRAQGYGYLHTHAYGGPNFEPYQEEEQDYLFRHGLLTVAEMEQLMQNE
jgi:hypothetical protein